LLDRVRPGWHQLIDLDVLFMRDGCQCILGQLEGGEGDIRLTPFLRELGNLGLDMRDAAALGFDLHEGEDTGDAREAAAWAGLDAAWRGLVAARREAGS
jgi:hypothetical protein